MSDYTIAITTTRPYDETVAAVRDQLGEAGFGVLTEIDLKAKLKEKLDEDIAPYVILGACMPQLAFRALQVEPSIGALLPCNVVVRSLDDGSTAVEAFDPQVMMSMADGSGGELSAVAEDARKRLTQALEALEDGGS